MYFTNALVVCASLAVAAVAQTSKLIFTTLPTSVTAGSPTTLNWAGGDGTAVTITLQQGLANNLQTVQIVTGSATGTSYSWTPDKSLTNGDNYALKITQGTSEVNYSGLFGLTGGSASSSSSASTASSTASSTDSSSMSATPVVPVPLPSTMNRTTTTAAMPGYNATTTAIIGTGMMTGTGVAASAGTDTGIPMSRNTTMSMATLTSASTTSTATTSGSSSGSKSSPSASPTRAASSAANLGSPLAFVLSAFIAVVYLG